MLGETIVVSVISHYDRGQAVSANDDNQSNCSFESRQLCNSSLILYESNVWVRETSGGGLELLCTGGVWGCRWGWEEELCSSGDVEGLDAVFAAARLLPPLKEGEGLGFTGREGLYSWVAQDKNKNVRPKTELPYILMSTWNPNCPSSFLLVSDGLLVHINKYKI